MHASRSFLSKIPVITCPVGSPDTLVAGATTLGAAAEKGHRTKRAAWEVLCASQGDSFLPLATECTGYTCDNIQTLFDTALERLDCSRGEAQAFNTYWRQRLGVAIVRGVAKTILGNMPRCTGAHYAVGRGLDMDLAPAPGPRPGNRTQNQHCAQCSDAPAPCNAG